MVSATPRRRHPEFGAAVKPIECDLREEGLVLDDQQVELLLSTASPPASARPPAGSAAVIAAADDGDALTEARGLISGLVWAVPLWTLLAAVIALR